MAYFNHAFNKSFLGTKKQTANAAQSQNVSGFIFGANSYTTASLINPGPTAATGLGLGSFGFFTPDGQTNVNNSNLSSGGYVCCPLVLASSALYQNDKIGPFAGGYQESTKSKMINPKYISRMYRVTPCLPNQSVLGIGNTPFTVSGSEGCCFQFLCNESYSLRIDIKGSPALRYLHHNAYRTTAKWTGCCDPTALLPLPVDPTSVYIAWATEFVTNPITAPFLQVIVYNQSGVAVGGVNDTTAWAAYVPVAVVACSATTPGAGMTIAGGYIDTKFGDCTFYPSDFFEKEPVKLYIEMEDYTGDVCAFTGICVKTICCPRQGMGFGETILRDVILSESYMQTPFYTGSDLRIREITQGYDVTSAINRNSFYTVYHLLHNVPRFNNPSGVFDNDQYMLEIITNGIDTNLQTFLANWTASCGPCSGMEFLNCIDPCCAIPAVAPQGVAAVAYSYQVTVPAGVTPPATGGFTMTGTLLTGLTLNANTGIISGTVILANIGTANVTVTVTDQFGALTGCFALQITVTA